jgi:hypothetical protein
MFFNWGFIDNYGYSQTIKWFKDLRGSRQMMDSNKIILKNLLK